MPSRKTKSKAVRIGLYTVTLLPGETERRVQTLARQVRAEWEPASVVEECECDTIVHARFKLERYERFFDHFVQTGIRAEDIRGAERSYRAALQLAEESLRIARETPRRKPPTRATEPDLASMPVRLMVQ
jgi:hypothetical protein